MTIEIPEEALRGRRFIMEFHNYNGIVTVTLQGQQNFSSQIKKMEFKIDRQAMTSENFQTKLKQYLPKVL